MPWIGTADDGIYFETHESSADTARSYRLHIATRERISRL
jgi:hypothetical protein